jgi:FKBP-type peptidyl-prolyl cis-trans isomerase
MAKDPGKTLQTATLFPLRESNRSTKDSLSASDPIDLWKLNNRVKSSLDLTLTGIAKPANVDVSLLNAKGRVIRSSSQRGNRAERLKDIPLEVGTFYVRVALQRRSAKTRYALTLSATPIANSPLNPPTNNPPVNSPVNPALDQFGNSFATATALRSATGSLKDFVGNSDPNDFLKLGALVAGRLNVELTGLSGDANLELYDQTQTLIFASRNSSTANDSLNQHLTDIAGSTYYLRVNAAAGQETPYTLNYSFVPDTTTQTNSGLRYIDLDAGTGAAPSTGQRVSVTYTGILTDGTKFDSAPNPNQPFEFEIGKGRVIAGWEEGISSMKVGGRRQLIIPPTLAYGATGIPGVIPGNATLIFDVTVVDIKETV